MATQPEVKADAGYGPEPQLTVAQPALHADPGGATQTQVVVRHGGNRVEGFALDVVGLPPAWWRVEPARLELLPGTSGTAVVEFRPPPGTPAPDAPLPFGVRATSALDAARSVVEEGDLEVGRQLSLTAEIAPLTSRARWRGRHVVTFTNWGNAPIDLALTGRDRDGRLAFLFAPAALKVPIGGTANSRLKARIRRPVLRGQREQLPFQVVATGPGGTPLPGAPGAPAAPGLPGDTGARTLDAVVEQRPVLSNGVLVLLGLVALLVVALVAWLVRAPAVRGAREDAAAPPRPQAVTLQGVTKDGKARVQWAQDDSAHRVGLIVDANGDPARKGSPQEWIDVAPYASVVTVAIKDFSRARTYCFAVKSVQGRYESAPVTSDCLQPSAGLAAPAGLVLKTLRDPAKALLTWNGSEKLDYLVVATDAKGAVLPGTSPLTVQKATRTEVTLTGDVACFTVQAIGAKARSEISKPECTAGPGPQASPSPSPTVSLSPSPSPGSPSDAVPPGTMDRLRGRWTIAVLVRPVLPGFDNAATTKELKAAWAALLKAGYPKGVEDAWYIQIPPVSKEPYTWVAYADVVPSRDEALQGCTELRQRLKGSPLTDECVPFLIPKAAP